MKISRPMKRLMRLTTPRSWVGLLVRMLLLLGMVAAVNVGFVHFAGPVPPAGAWWYLPLQASVVGAPFIAFFFVVALLQFRLQQRLVVLSRTDWLTGLNNRRSFLETALQRQQASANSVLLVLDADNFKHINDTYGHHAGDKCLQSIAFMLRRNLRDDDVVGRIGGEEFAILLADTGVDQARVIGDRLTRPIPFKAGPDQQHLTVTLSVGAVRSVPGMSLDTLLNQADRALYQAKAQGRARLIFAPTVADVGGGGRVAGLPP